MHTLFHADCLHVLPDMEPGSVDVVVTSPPYNIGINYGRYNDSREEQEYLDWMERVYNHIARVLKPEGSLFLNLGAGGGKSNWLPQKLALAASTYFQLQNEFVWVKSIAIDEVTRGQFSPISSPRYVNRTHEKVFHLTQRGDVKIDRLAIGVPLSDKNNLDRFGHAEDKRCRGNTWFIPYKTVQSRAEKGGHIAIFPETLPEWCIRLHGGDNLVVLDPFMGTGTTIVAASKLGHHGIGIELDEKYIAIAKNRLLSCSPVG